jgi:hypothetical protein
VCGILALLQIITCGARVDHMMSEHTTGKLFKAAMSKTYDCGTEASP